MIDRRTLILAALAPAVTDLAGGATFADSPVIRPEDFGAKGDGVSNDTDAFAAMSDHVNRLGGGTIELRPRTYIVGRQRSGIGPWAYTPDTIIQLRRLNGPLTILGNGAQLKCAAGMRYGTFDPRSGEPVTRPVPNLRREEVASPYIAMIELRGCKGTIDIRDVELDGNIAAFRIGGPYGDQGRQIPATGLMLFDNSGTELVSNVYTHHHGQDGAMISGDERRTARSRITKLVSRFNGRQGLSLTGGRGYDFAGCEFSRTGRAGVRSAPGAGVDIEAEGGKTNRDHSFTDCKFLDNAGVGFVADSGDSEGIVLTRCTFVGTTSWSAWPYKPRIRFSSCLFVGTLVHAFNDPNPERATRFFDCTFTDDRRLSPTGSVYLGGNVNYPIVDLAESQNVLFKHCIFRLTGPGLLPWSWRATYWDCVMSQASTVQATPKGKYLGRSTIRGKVNLYGSMVLGSLTVNGVPQAKGSQGGPPW
jgi:hypothetical protein